MARLLSLPGVLTVRGQASGGKHVLRPRMKTDGKFALPDSVWSSSRWGKLTPQIAAEYVETLLPADMGDPEVDLIWMGRELVFSTALNTPHAVTSPASNILSFVTAKDDFGFVTDKANGYVRSEVVSTTAYDKAAVYWWSFAFKVTSGAPIAYGHCMVGQMHGADTKGFPRPPITTMVLANDLMRIRTQYSTDPTSQGATSHRVPSNDSVPRDQWVRMVIEERQGTGTGYINVWRDGVQVISNTNINLGYINDDRGPNFQIGTYRSNDGSTLEIQIANWEFGTADLSSRISNPLPI